MTTARRQLIVYIVLMIAVVLVGSGTTYNACQRVQRLRDQVNVNGEALHAGLLLDAEARETAASTAPTKAKRAAFLAIARRDHERAARLRYQPPTNCMSATLDPFYHRPLPRPFLEAR